MDEADKIARHALALAIRNIIIESKLQKLTQSKIAKRCGLSKNTVSKIFSDLSGQSMISAVNLLKVWVVGLQKRPEDLFKKGGLA